MRLKFLTKSLLFGVSIMAIVLSLIAIFLSTLNPSFQNSSSKPPSVIVPANLSVFETGIGLPTRLKIPQIKVDANVEGIGINPKGEMGIPKLPGDTAWYNLGPRPGEIGSAVMAGHLNWYNGATGVFANLNKLQTGDKILVHDDKGNEISFVVKKVRTYEASEDATNVFISKDGKAHLNLVTCDGVWDKLTKQYSKRLVVFAEKE